MWARPDVTWSSRYNIANQLFNTPAGTHLYPGMGSVDVAGRAGQLDLPLAPGRGIAPLLQRPAIHRRRTPSPRPSTMAAALSRTEQIYQSLRLDRALADTDVRHRFVFSGVYELPFGHGKRFANHLSKPLDMVVGGWQLNTILTIQSGLPFTLTTPGSPSNAPSGRDRQARHAPRQHAALLRHERGRAGAHQQQRRPAPAGNAGTQRADRTRHARPSISRWPKPPRSKSASSSSSGPKRSISSITPYTATRTPTFPPATSGRSPERRCPQSVNCRALCAWCSRTPCGLPACFLQQAGRRR